MKSFCKIRGKFLLQKNEFCQKKMSVIMKGCILMNRIKSFCKGVDQINSLLIKKNIEILCQSMTFSVLELQRGYIYQLYQNGLEFRQKVIGAFFGIIFTTMDLSLALGHISEYPSSGGTCYKFEVVFCLLLGFGNFPNV